MQADAYTFYRIPKVLFSDPYFKKLSCEAKVLYGILLKRMDLSAKNGWQDNENRVYIIFTIEDIMEATKRTLRIFWKSRNSFGGLPTKS